MTLTTNHSSTEVEKFTDRFVEEYSQHNTFAPYMGSSANSIIWVDRKLQTDKGGNYTQNLSRNLADDDGIVGNGQMEGNEEKHNKYGQRIGVEFYRKGVVWTKRESQRTKIEAMKAARPALMTWKTNMIRRHVIRELGNITTPTTGEFGVAYASATDGQKDAWNTGNQDRIMYGDANGNLTVGDHSASCLAVTSGMTATGAWLSAFKRKALGAGEADAERSKITPVQVKKDNNEYWMQVFMPSFVFRDFIADPAVNAAQRDANVRGSTNPMFRGGDYLWDGMVVREIKDIPNISETGAASVPLAPVYLCGQVAVHVGYAQDAQFHTEKRDYNFYTGVTCELDYGVRKAVWQGNDGGTVYSDYGVATAFMPNVPDA